MTKKYYYSIKTLAILELPSFFSCHPSHTLMFGAAKAAARRMEPETQRVEWNAPHASW